MRLVLLAGLILLAMPLQAQDHFLDASFGANGIVLDNPHVSPGSGGVINALLPLANGKLLAAGGYNGKAAVMRYTANGIPDNDFGMNGIYSGPNQSTANAMLIQPDGKIVIEGWGLHTNSMALTIRLNADGSPDNTFGLLGVVYTNFAFQTTDLGDALALQADGKIIIAGVYNTGFITLARLKPDGVVDSSFGLNGVTITNVAGKPTGVAVLPDGKIILGGDRVPQYQFIAMRFLSNGTADTSFNHTGLSATNVGDSYPVAHAFQLQSDGKVLVGGTGTFGNQGANFAVARFMQDGGIDPSYGHQGIATTDKNSGDDLRAMYLLPDGKLLVAGGTAPASNYIFAVARIDSTGNPDHSFGDDGWITTFLLDSNDYVYAVAAQPDGKAIFAGTVHNDVTTNDEIALARYNISANAVASLPNISFSTFLFPNPASGTLYADPSKHICDIVAYDLFGKSIHLSSSRDGAIDIHALSAGLYLFKIITEKASPIYQKITVR